MTIRRSTPLSRDVIFAAALAIVDAEGVGHLSMRRLARDLGVEAMSLYHHVRDKQELLGGIVEQSLRMEAPAPPSPGAKWQDVAAGAVLAFRRTLVAHPNVLPIMAAHPPTSPESFSAHVGTPFRFFVAHGLAEKEATRLIESLFALGFGHAMLTTNYKEMRGQGVHLIHFTEASFDQTVRLLLEGYSAGVTRSRNRASLRTPTVK
jgi:TetR/AcrR family transcriptional regulator, tetracycline repressor protein